VPDTFVPPPSRWRRFKAALRRAFSVEPEPLTPEEQALLEKIAAKIRARGLETPAVLFLESVRPLNMVGAQVMIGLQPFVELAANPADYERLTQALEKRPSIDILIRLLEKPPSQPDAGGT
jgi:hypothetical protein